MKNINKRFKNELVNTFIGEETSIKGIIHTQRSIRIEGNIDGEINSQGEIYVGQKSKVKANIIGKSVIVAGEVKGNIEAINGLRVTSTGKVYGDISGDHLMIDEGAVYKGKVNMDIISAKSDYESELELAK